VTNLNLLDNIKKRTEKLHNEYKLLEAKKKILNETEKEAKAECDENYQLKFGRTISLEILDGIKIANSGLEPTEKLKELQKEFIKEEKESIKSIDISRRNMLRTNKELLDLKKQNTEIIKNITSYGNLQLSLNKNFDSTNKNLFVSKC